MVLRVDFYPAVISGDPQVWILFMGLGVAPMGVMCGWEGRDGQGACGLRAL